jgi:Adenylate sensor of SNF1-like protein kinase
VIGFLNEPRENSAKKAYYLIAETEVIHQSTEKAQERGLTKNDSYLSASPPPWNHSDLQQRLASARAHPMSRVGNLHMTSASPQPPQSNTPDTHAVDTTGDDDGTHSKSNPRSKISLLTSSYPLVHARMYRQATDSETDAARSVRGINLEHLPGELKVQPTVIKRKPQRYHFGIRSRGQGALEVMQEIYKSLERMGAEWVEKQPNPDSDDKSIPLDPFTIKCRWRKLYPRKSVHNKVSEGEDDMFVYMEIQLYQQPEPRDYLVDFKWVRYELLNSTEKVQPPGEDGVQSCFPFLDLASTLINALARGGD